MLIAANLPKFLWTETLQHTTWLKNRTAMCVLGGKTPFKMIHKSKPNLEGLPEWGVHIFMLYEGRGKLEEQANEGHCVYWPRKHCITVERKMNFSIAIQHDSMAEGWQNTPVTQDQAQSPSQPPPTASPHTDPLQGFEPTPTDALGCGQCACKP